MFAVKMSTSAILLVKKTKILRLVQVSVGLLVLGIVISLSVVETVISSVAIFFFKSLGYFSSDDNNSNHYSSLPMPYSLVGAH